MSRSNSILDQIQLDRQSETPLYLQLARTIRGAIEVDQLREGERLPATRQLADRLGVNRATIVGAYRWLQQENWVVSGVGSGTYVRRGRSRPVVLPAEVGDKFWSSRLDELPRPESGAPTLSAPEETIRLTSPTADPAAFPVDEFQQALTTVFEREGARCLDYGPPDGYGPLRELIAERLAKQGAEVDRSRIIIVNGSQQGLELILRLLVPRGRTLLVEQPTYHLALRAARALGLAMRPVPMDEEGLRVDSLEKILDETSAGMLYTMPVFQNPTGLTLSAGRRAQLLEITRERGLPIVEDHYDADLDYRGDAPPPLLAEANRPNVILLGTISKILFPAPRVGWLVVPEPLIGPLSEMKICADLSSGLLTQMALHQFCAEGHLDTHLTRMRERNGSRLAATLQALEETMPKGARWTHPTGGMTLWLWLPRGLDSEAVAREALRRGVAISEGTTFYVDGGGRDGLRLCYVREPEERIREGISLLAETILQMSARRPARDEEGAPAPIL